MTKKRKIYKGAIEWVSNNQIYLNIHNLKEGLYTIKITENNKVLKEVTFKKNKT